MKDWFAFSLLALLFWGLWAFFPRFAVNYISPRSLTVYQTMGILLVTACIFLVGPWKVETHPMGVFIGILSGVCGIIGSFFYNLAMQKGKASVVLSLTALYPLVALILVFLVFREAITIKQGLGIAFALAAVTLLST